MANLLRETGKLVMQAMYLVQTEPETPDNDVRFHYLTHKAADMAQVLLDETKIVTGKSRVSIDDICSVYEPHLTNVTDRLARAVLSFEYLEEYELACVLAVSCLLTTINSDPNGDDAEEQRQIGAVAIMNAVRHIENVGGGNTNN